MATDRTTSNLSNTSNVESFTINTTTGIRIDVEVTTPIASVIWILGANVWNDSGQWVDSAVWKD